LKNQSGSASVIEVVKLEHFRVEEISKNAEKELKCCKERRVV
jgi:hypothetical protein